MPIGESYTPAGVIGASRPSIDSNISENVTKGKQREEIEVSSPGHTGIRDSGRDLAYRQPKGFWGTIWKHFKRYWLCYGLLGFVFLAVFLPVFFVVIFPAIAQKLVDDAGIPIHSAQILKPTPDGIVFSLSATLDVPLGLSVHIDPFNLSLFNRDIEPRTPYVSVELPAFHLKGKSDITITNQTTRILDMDQFTKFLAVAVYSKAFTLSAYGKTTAHLGALHAPLTLDKDVTLNGLDMLNGFSIGSASLQLPPASDGSNLIGTATLPNYSVVTFALGNVTLNLKVGDLLLGNGTIENVQLAPGNNTVPLRGTLDISTALANIGTLLAAESNALSDGNLMLSASGNSTVYDGVHISYFEEVLNNLTISAYVPVLQVLFGTLAGLISSNSGIISNITSILRETDLSSGPNL